MARGDRPHLSNGGAVCRVSCVTAGGPARAGVAVALLADHGHAGAPVEDERGRLSGVLHAFDVALAHLPPLAEQARPVVVRSLLRPPVTVEPISPIHVAAERMRSNRSDQLVRGVGAIAGVTEIEELITARRPPPS